MDYRLFLNDMFFYLKNEKKYFTQAYFAKMAGLGSNSYLRMVIQGQRNLKVDTLRRFARAFKLDKNESLYFETLALFNQTKSDAEQDEYFELLVKLRPKKALMELSRDEFEYFTERHFVAIREMAALPNFQDDPEWIVQNIRLSISAAEAKHALMVLERLGLLVRKPDGHLTHSFSTLTTQPFIESIEIYRYNRNLMNEVKRAMAELPPQFANVSSVTIPVQSKALQGVNDILQRCREEIAQFVSNFDGDFAEVFQLNMQFYPLTHANLKEGDSSCAK